MPENEWFKVWITKNALLARGIFTAEAKRDTRFTNVIFVPLKSCKQRIRGKRYYLNEWHTDAASAVARAEQMRDARVAELEREIVRLQAKTFEYED